MAEAKTFHAVVDAVEEGTYVVLFDEGLKLHLSRKHLPKGTTEGSVLKVTFELDPAEEERRIGEIRSLQERLLRRTREGK
jgi:hypothetical protein